MDWYYAEHGSQQGPVSDDEFKNLVLMGRIKASTLVWRSGMSDWKPWSEVAPTIGMESPADVIPLAPSEPSQPASSPAASSPYDYSRGSAYGAGPAGGGYAAPGGYQQPAAGYGVGASAGALPQTGTVFCSQCGRPHPAEEMVELFNQAVCPSCKPYFLQRMQEGTMSYGMMAGVREYGGFWIRFVAKFIDGIILFFIGIIIQIPFILINLSQSTGGDPFESMMFSSSPLMSLFSNVIGTMVSCAYTTFFLGKYAATPGKMACGLRVIVADGTRISYLRAFGRYWAEILSYCTCTIGYIIAAFDEEKRTLHDHICSTRVIKAR